MTPSMAMLLGLRALLSSLKMVCLRMVARLSGCAAHSSYRQLRNRFTVCFVLSRCLMSCTITCSSQSQVSIR